MRFLSVALCAFLAAAAFPARAQATDNDDLSLAKAKYREAARQFDLTEYAAALDGFREAYRLAGDPVFLFNIAQCHRKLGHTQEALTFYKSYLRRRPDAANRDEVERRITEMEKAEAAQPTAPTPAPGVEKAPEPVAKPVPLSPPPVASATEPRQPPPAGVDLSTKPAPEPEHTPVYKTWWFWTATGAVVAGGLTATLLLTRKSSGVFCADCNLTSGVATK